MKSRLLVTILSIPVKSIIKLKLKKVYLTFKTTMDKFVLLQLQSETLPKFDLKLITTRKIRQSCSVQRSISNLSLNTIAIYKVGTSKTR